MITTVGNLSSKGVSFYRDEHMREEIPQYAVLNTQQNKEIEFYIGARSRIDSVGRVGRILALEENFKTFFIDMVQEVDGNVFRNFDHVELFEVETTFDSYGFMRNMLLQFMDKELWNALNFISMPHMGSKDVKKTFERCLALPGKYRFVECEDAGEEEVFRPFKPVGYWGVEYPPDGYYKFITDFFVNPHERDRVSIWDQWNRNQYIRRANINKYFNYGFSFDGENYNYLNNVYPEHKALMDYRWRMGGFDVQLEEYRAMRPSIYKKFIEWYGPGAALGFADEEVYSADERTVKFFTRIGRVELDPIFKRDKPILERLLGPLSCLHYVDGICMGWGFGESDIYDNAEFQENLFNFSQPDGPIEGIETENFFKVLSAPGFVSMTNAQIQSQESYEEIVGKGPNPIEAMYAIDHSFGMIGGQTIYDNGAGNEYRYSLTLRAFLKEQGWTLEEFMELYKKPIQEREAELRDSLISGGEPVRVKDFSEFYDKDTKSPFDGIHHYIPVPLHLRIGKYETPFIIVKKKRVEVTQDGEEIIHNLPDEQYGKNTFTLDINKDEFVSEVRIDSLSVLMTRFLKTRVKIRFKDSIPNLDQVKIRLFTTDFTYMNEREIFIS